MANIDPILVSLVVLGFVTLLVGIILKYFKQPTVIAYIITGVILGPFVLGLFKDSESLARIGELGVVLLLFFLGMEISLNDLLKNWKISFFGTVVQAFLSVLAVFGIGYFFGWEYGRIILLGFVISLSSTTVVMNYLKEEESLETPRGQKILGILIVQDLIAIPMIIILSLIGGNSDTIGNRDIITQIVGGFLMVSFIFYLLKKKTIKLPFSKHILKDKELQVFAAFIICFGMASLAGLFQLSTAIGSFLAGIFLASTKETKWVYESLDSFRVLFVSLFFVSIGMLINPFFIVENFLEVLAILFLIFVTNTFINAVILRFSGESWKNSFYAGSLLSHIGEFSFILAAIGFGSGLIGEFSYDMTITVIALSLLISPFWISIFSKIKNYKKS